MAISGADFEKLRSQNSNYTPTVNITPEQQALLWANMKPYNNLSWVTMWVIFGGIFGCFALFASQYRWVKSKQELVKSGILMKISLLFLGLMSTASMIIRVLSMGAGHP
jgi:heme/copper-type cytochrome/quinol oxidase subunit 2